MRGLEEPFFQLCCCVSFWFWREIGFGCTYYYVLGVPYSCGVVLVFWFWREIALTDRQNDKLTDRESNTLASRGLEEPAHALHGLEEAFFQLCCCVSFWFWREIGFGCTYYYVLAVPYNCGVVLVFLVLAGNSPY